MQKKYDFINLIDIAGIGIWALGYDGEYPNLYDAISEKFSTNGNNLCEGIFTDIGGSKGNYYNNEEWIHTIAPKNSEHIYYYISELNIELNYDTLFVYDGSDTTANLIDFFTENNFTTETIETSTGAVTFYFKSDVATVKEGLVIHWSCSPIIVNLEDIKTVNSIQIFPNPSNNYFNISSEFTDISEIKIYDVLGKIVLEKNVDINENTDNILINHNLQEGLYLVKVISDSTLYSKKIIVKK